MKVLTVGCDPEVFLSDRKRGVIIPSCGLIGGTKDMGLDIGEGVKILEDNVTVEFNTEPVTYEPEARALTTSATKALNVVEAFLKKKNKNYGIEILSSHMFDARSVESEAARTFGCEPDLDAYTQGGLNQTFTAEQVGMLRMAGGHIHLGYPQDITTPKWALVQLLDALVTYHWWSSVGGDIIGAERMKFYGRPGAYRDKPYGVEYRTPSNNWLVNSDFAEDICDTAWWAVNFEAETKTVYDMINFNQVQRGFQHQLNSDQRDTLYRSILRLREKVQSRIPSKPKDELILNVAPRRGGAPRIRMEDFVRVAVPARAPVEFDPDVGLAGAIRPRRV